MDEAINFLDEWRRSMNLARHFLPEEPRAHTPAHHMRTIMKPLEARMVSYIWSSSKEDSVRQEMLAEYESYVWKVI